MKHERILYEDNDIFVCHKPAGIATQTARVGQADMVSEITNYLKASGSDLKTPLYVGVVHRLDQPVEGILVFAKNKAAAADLSRQAAGDGMKKEYLPEVKGAKEAKLSYEVLSAGPSGTALVKVRLYTGRHHQIRVQMTNAGMPLLGDHKYAGEAALKISAGLGVREIALCAYRLAFVHPKTGKNMQFEIKPEGAAFQRGVYK